MNKLEKTGLILIVAGIMAVLFGLSILWNDVLDDTGSSCIVFGFFGIVFGAIIFIIGHYK